LHKSRWTGTTSSQVHAGSHRKDEWIKASTRA